MPKNGFPLLKLPQLVLFECVENLDVLEILILSLLSKRARKVAQLNRWNISEMEWELGYENQISLSTPSDPCRKWIINYDRKNDTSKYPYFESELTGDYVKHYLFQNNTENNIEEMKHIVENIWEVFRAPIRYIKIFDESFIEWLLKFQPTILSLWIKEDVITSFETLDRIFKNLKVESFDLESIKTDKTTKVMEPIPFPYITVQNSYWLTLPAILNGSYTIICLYGSELTPKDINTILKEWQMGTKLQSLLCLEIRTVTLLDAESCILEIYKDLNLTLSDIKDERPTIRNIHDENIYRRAQENRTLNLVRSDGTIGSITKSYIVDEYRKNAIYFRLFVW